MILFIEEGMFSPDEAERGDELEGLSPPEAEAKIAELSAGKEEGIQPAARMEKEARGWPIS